MKPSISGSFLFGDVACARSLTGWTQAFSGSGKGFGLIHEPELYEGFIGEIKFWDVVFDLRDLVRKFDSKAISKICLYIVIMINQIQI